MTLNTTFMIKAVKKLSFSYIIIFTHYGIPYCTHIEGTWSV